MTVAVGYTHTGMVHQPFMQCLINMMSYDSSHGKLVKQLIGIGHPYIPYARQSVVEQFLLGDADWLLFLDYDMIFDGHYLETLHKHANEEGLPIVGALYYTYLYGEKSPCWMEYRDGEHNQFMKTIELDRFYELSTVGMGFTLIHREVFEKMRVQYSDDPWCWYGHDIAGDSRIGEDVTFCARARNIGYVVWGDSHVNCGHIKPHIVSHESFSPTTGDTSTLSIGT